MMDMNEDLSSDEFKSPFINPYPFCSKCVLHYWFQTWSEKAQVDIVTHFSFILQLLEVAEAESFNQPSIRYF